MQSWFSLRYYPTFTLEEQRKTMKSLSQNSWFPGTDLNPKAFEYEAGSVITDSDTQIA
jgi:hypothetical protein